MPKEDKSNKNMAFIEIKIDEGGPELATVLDESGFKAALEKRSDAASFKPVLSVRPRRDLRKTRTLTGGVLVELESKAKADALLKASKDEPLLPKQTKVKVVTTVMGCRFSIAWRPTVWRSGRRARSARPSARPRRRRRRRGRRKKLKKRAPRRSRPRRRRRRKT